MVDEQEVNFEEFIWPIPASNQDNDLLEIKIQQDSRIFFVGPNGSGKSALVQHFISSMGNKPLRRLSAHRQNWLNSGGGDITPKSRLDLDNNIINHERRDDSRWVDHLGSQRLSVVLYDLVAAENQRARSIADLVDNKSSKEAEELSVKEVSPFEQINALLRAGNLTVQIDASPRQEILAHHVEGDQFSIAKLSDGERNAVILAATVLTVDPGTILLIDEPERHLHRSIIEPFLCALFDNRPDCPFIISTHELALPVATPQCDVVLPRSCSWQGEKPVRWEIDLLDSSEQLPDDLKHSVLGSRNTILFVEGILQSLDTPLYGILLPDVTVNPRGSCSEVIKAVNGLTVVNDIHWISAYGLIDRDDRSDEEVASLEQQNIFALKVYSAEAIYYSYEAIRSIAKLQAKLVGVDADNLFNKTIGDALGVLSDEDTKRRMCARRCERFIRGNLYSAIPDWHEIENGSDISINIPIEETLQAEIAVYDQLITAKDYGGLISRYPIRETPLRRSVASSLEFKSQANFEKAVLALASDDKEFRNELRTFINPLIDSLRNAGDEELVVDEDS